MSTEIAPSSLSAAARPFELRTTPNRERRSMFRLFAPHCLDAYKLNHRPMYPKGTEYVYSNFTVRNMKHLKIPAEYRDNKYVVYGVEAAMKEIVALWDETFFTRPKEEVLAQYRNRVPAFTGKEAYVQHLADLHDLGYLPIRVKMLPEGSRVNVGVPFLTIVNTLPNYFWLTNGLETNISNEIWKPMTVATIAHVYRRMLTDYAEKTGSPKDFIDWQGHCFADRGMSGMMDAAKSCSGHSTSFLGTDSVSSMDWIDFVYQGKDSFNGGSVGASEHAVMCVDGKDGEVDTIRRIITLPEFEDGVVSIVSDTWDFWHVITEVAQELKPVILGRKFNALGLSKVVFRPDSGDPADVICGTARSVKSLDWDGLKPIYLEVGKDQVRRGVFGVEAIVVEYQGKYYQVVETPTPSPAAPLFKEVTPTPQQKGAVACLWDGFGGEITDKGYKAVSQRVGLIYGDSITPEIALDVLKRLEAKGFASCNIVFGIGSYTYQYITRDTLGAAIKATFAVVNGVGREMAKDPATDVDKTKKSARGLLKVLRAQEAEGEKFILVDQVDWDEENTGSLRVGLEDGNFLVNTPFAEIKERLLAA